MTTFHSEAGSQRKNQDETMNLFYTKITSVIFFSILTTLFITGCCSTQLKNPGNIVIVSPQGDIVDPNSNPVTNNWVANIFTNMLDSAFQSKTNILIFFQGGLNNYGNGIERANDISSNILDDPDHPYYPIFFTWNSSLISSWGDQLFLMLPDGENLRHKSYPLAIYNFPADAGRLIGRIPITFLLTSKNLVASATEFTELGELKSTNIPTVLELGGHRAAIAYTNIMGKGIKVCHQTNDISSFKLVCRGYEGALLAYPQLAGAFIVDTGGKEGWDQMVRRTDTMFVKPLEPSWYSNGGTEVFVEQLTNFLNIHRNYTVTLVAHSMGTIVANEIIRRHGADLHIKNIVYMAAACGVQDFAKDVIPFLAANTNVYFYNLCLNPLNDRGENHFNSWTWGFPEEILSPHGSLLQWIDDYYSTADTTFGWTMGKLINVVPGLDAQMIPPEVCSRITLTYFGIGSLKNCGPQKHGDFSNVRYWDEDFWKGNWSTNMASQGPSPTY